MKHFSSIASIVLAAVLAMCIATVSCRKVSGYRTCEGAIWATAYHITYCSEMMLDDSIAAMFAAVDKSLSPFNDASTVSMINRSETDVTDSLMRRCLAGSSVANALSGGAFDPTLAPLINLWGFGYQSGNGEPTQQQIDSALCLVGLNRCTLAGDRLTKPVGGMQFNFSAIAKGLACDLIAEMLRRNGCTDYMVEIGGEVSLGGLNRHGSKWHIMIDAPVSSDSTGALHTRLGVIEATDCGMATSGNYRNYRMTASGRIWHTISPATGYPAETSILSATVIAPTAMMADALATACMAMEPDSAMAMIGRVEHVSAMFVMNDTIVTSAGFPAIQF